MPRQKCVDNVDDVNYDDVDVDNVDDVDDNVDDVNHDDDDDNNGDGVGEDAKTNNMNFMICQTSLLCIGSQARNPLQDLNFSSTGFGWRTVDFPLPRRTQGLEGNTNSNWAEVFHDCFVSEKKRYFFVFDPLLVLFLMAHLL